MAYRQPLGYLVQEVHAHVAQGTRSNEAMRPAALFDGVFTVGSHLPSCVQEDCNAENKTSVAFRNRTLSFEFLF